MMGSLSAACPGGWDRSNLVYKFPFHIIKDSSSAEALPYFWSKGSFLERGVSGYRGTGITDVQQRVPLFCAVSGHKPSFLSLVWQSLYLQSHSNQWRELFVVEHDRVTAKVNTWGFLRTILVIHPPIYTFSPPFSIPTSFALVSFFLLSLVPSLFSFCLKELTVSRLCPATFVNGAQHLSHLCSIFFLHIKTWQPALLW